MFNYKTTQQRKHFITQGKKQNIRKNIYFLMQTFAFSFASAVGRLNGCLKT